MNYAAYRGNLWGGETKLLDQKLIRDLSNEYCPMRATLALLGQKWVPHILFELSDGKRRFNELGQRIGGCNSRTLRDRLRNLELLGIVERHPIIRTLAGFNPFAVLFESYRSIIYGTETTGAVAPNVMALAFLLLGSIVFIGLAMIAFKKLEPNFAKVL